MKRPNFLEFAGFDDVACDLDQASFAAGWPVVGPVPTGETPVGLVEFVALPGSRIVNVRHVGSYDELGNAYRALLDYIHKK